VILSADQMGCPNDCTEDTVWRRGDTG